MIDIGVTSLEIQTILKKQESVMQSIVLLGILLLMLNMLQNGAMFQSQLYSGLHSNRVAIVTKWNDLRGSELGRRTSPELIHLLSIS